MSLVAVVLVFTVCQIPQAISLSLQSFLPTLAQTSKVLIFNNFANSFVALNASINFLLYCCFSDRFRSIFSANVTCRMKCGDESKRPKYMSRQHSSAKFTLLDQISIGYTMISRLNKRRSNSPNDINDTFCPTSLEINNELCKCRYPITSKFASKQHLNSRRVQFQRTSILNQMSSV
jgi:hypothetical protein